MEGIKSLNLIIGVSGLAISVLGLVQAITGRSMQKKTQQYFIAFFILLTAYAGFNLADQLGDAVNGMKVPLFFESAISSLLTLLLTRFLLDQSGCADWRRTPAFRAAAGLELLYLAILVYTQFSTTIYYFDADGVYYRGEYYPVLLIPPICIMLVNLFLLWDRGKWLSIRERKAFAVYIIIPMVCMLWQMQFYGVYVIVLGTAISAMAMFVNIQNDQTEKYIEKERENDRLRTDIMLSQIKPHFLYNTLGAIQELCDSDPKAAGVAIVRFTRYLQGNMMSLTESGVIAFEKELQHTKAYLDLEQMRFEDKLIVHYDITCTDFSLPTLTLQPIVENAVRHGARGKKKGAGTVSLATREYPDRFEVTVTDDGPGFDPNAPATANDGHAHIGISNVRGRLRDICGGDLWIESELGKGTRVTLILPKKG